MSIIKIKRLHPDAKLPARANPTDSGLDLFAFHSGLCGSQRSTVIETGIAIALPYGYEAQIRPRSGLAFKHDIICHFGTIDNSFHESIKVKLFNLSDGLFVWEEGDRIAQLVVVAVELPTVEEVEELPNVGRGGFGSTGR